MIRRCLRVGGRAAIRLAVAIALVAAAPAHASQVERWRAYIEEASARFGIPVPWIERVMRAESAGRTTLDGRPIRSRKGAMGLMQLMPATWSDMRARLGLGANPDDPRDNILAGTFYLRLMYERFGHPGLFAAYNAGPGRYAAVLAGRRPLPAETVAYLGAVGGGPGPARSVPPSPSSRPPQASLFVIRRDAPADASPEGDRASQESLFAIRRDTP